ncbi:crotonase/enoyl-CoA hydratase family protein [Rhodovibrionaceae bacterium A322]
MSDQKEEFLDDVHSDPKGTYMFADNRALPMEGRASRALLHSGPSFKPKFQNQVDHWISASQSYRSVDVRLDRKASALWAYMNPQDRPSVTRQLAEESRHLQSRVSDLLDAQEREGEDPLRYVVWASRLNGIFNLGGDLPLFASLIRERDRLGLMDYALACVDVVYNNAVALDLPLQTLCLVQGDALGGGFEAAISANVVIAERQSKFGLPEVLFNLFPGMGAYSLIARRTNAITAERLIFSGKVYSAEEMYDMGLVDVLCEEGEGVAAVDQFIKQNQRNQASRCAIYKARQMLNPLTLKEMQDITESWVEAALKLEECDLKRMERLAKAQNRRVAN